MCFDKDVKDKEELVSLKDYINYIYSGNINWGMVSKQIASYQEKGYKLSGIRGTLHYCFEIKKMDKSKSLGIGIVEYYYKQAGEYFRAVGRMDEEQKFEYTCEEITIPTPQADRMTRLKTINMEEL